MEYFTLFVLLPSKDICSLRRLPSGVTSRDIRDRLEMAAGLPGPIYKLTTNKGQVLHEDFEFTVGQNVWDGYIVKVQLRTRWQLLYEAVVTANVQWLLSDETLQLQRGGVALTEDRHAAEIVEERGTVALFLASWRGSRKICQELLSIGVNPNGRTHFRRSAMFAAVAKDRDAILELLLTHRASSKIKDCHGLTALDVARRIFSRRCVNVFRSFMLRGTQRTEASKGRFRVDLSNEIDAVTTTFVDVASEALSTRSRPFTAIERPRTERKTKLFSRAASTIQRYRTNLNDKGSVEATKECVMPPDASNNTAAQARIQTQLRVAVFDSSGRPATTISWDDYSLRESELLSVRPAFREGKRALRALSDVPSATEGEPVTPSSSAVPWSHEDRPPSAGSPRSGQNESSVHVDCRSVQSAPNVITNTKIGKGMATQSDSHIRKKLKPKTAETKPFRNIKRQIQLSERLKRTKSAETNRSITFDQWLQRKRLQESESSDDTDYSLDEENDENNEEAFQNWLKDLKTRSQSTRHSALNSKKIGNGKGFIQICGSDISKTSEPVDTSLYLRAYQEWKKQRKAKRKDGITDPKKLKNILDAKSREYTARAITHEEWLKYSAERQDMTKLLHDATKEEQNKNSSDRGVKKKLTFHQWRLKLEERENIQRASRLRMRMEQSLINGSNIKTS